MRPDVEVPPLRVNDLLPTSSGAAIGQLLWKLARRKSTKRRDFGLPEGTAVGHATRKTSARSTSESVVAVAYMLLLGLAIFLHHILYFSRYGLLGRQLDFIVQSRVASVSRFFVSEVRRRSVGVVQAAVGANAFGQCESQTHQQMFVAG